GDQPPQPVSDLQFPSWTEALLKYAYSEPVTRDVDYWRRELANVVPYALVEPDCRNYAVEECEIVGEADYEVFETTERTMHQKRGTAERNLLLTLFVLSILDVFGKDRIVIEIESHGRSPLKGFPDVSESIGWFTSAWPLEICRYGGDPEELAILESVARKMSFIPHDGLHYGLLRYVNKTIAVSFE